MGMSELRSELLDLHQELVRNELVAWTSGNISARDSETGFVLIKPSGVAYNDLALESFVVVDLDGTVQDGDLAPSSDTLTHCQIYRDRPDVGGIVHTHSRHATAFAVIGESIPCVTTAMADEFGGPIPCGGLARIGDESIGRIVVDTLRHSRSPACLLQNHGVFALGPTPRAAVKAAVMTEDNAAVVLIARQSGAQPLGLTDEYIDALYERYQNEYGQPTDSVQRGG